jgi:PKD repeat protein
VNKTVNEGELLSFKVSATDPDGDTIIYSMQPSSEPIAEGATLDPDTGVFSWTPSYLQEGKYYVTFIAFGNDPMWWSGETIIITVNNVNLAPVIEPIGHKKVDEARPLVFSVNGSDDSVLKLIYSVSALPEGASFAEAWAGKLMTGYQFSWTPSFDQAGSYPVTFTVSDGELSASETIVITVNNVDRPPVLNPIGNKSIDEGKLLRFTVSGSDPDGDKLIYSVSSLPKRAIFKQISSVTGTAYQFKWTPAYNQAGKYSITFKISAGNLSASEVITITVNNVNRPPVATRTRMITVKRKIPTPITLTGTDPDNDKLTYIVTQKPLTGLLSGTPPNLVYTADKKGTYYLKYKAYDGNLYSNEATITIAVL